MSKSAARVQAALHAAGLDARVMELPQSTRTAAEAAQACGCEVGQIAKSLVFVGADGEAVLVIASGTNRVNEKRLGLQRASAEFVREKTGYAIGGVCPIGHAVAPVMLLDQDLFRYQSLWAAAGHPHAVFNLTPHQLQQMTGAEVADVAAGSVA